MPSTAISIQSQLRSALPKLTPTERQLATHILSNFPVTVLGTVAAVARAASVSNPTVVRLVQKLGYSGYPEFQAALHDELGEKLASPIAKHDKWINDPSNEPVAYRFANKLVDNLTQTLNQMDPKVLEGTIKLLADPDRSVYTLGGRLTLSMADYLSTTLKVMRGNVIPLSAMPNSWPPALLDMKPGDVLVAYDIRRYEPRIVQLVELASEQGVEVVLITDRWVSPAAPHAHFLLPCFIEVPSALDTIAPLMALTEILLAGVQEQRWEATSERLERLEELYERTRIFKRGR